MSKAGENALLKEFLLSYSKAGHRLFRNNVGMGWTGKTSGPVKQQQAVKLNPGDLVLRGGRPFHAGFPKGASDLIGFTTVQITPDMVGNQVAVFTAVEAKTKHVSATSEQKAFVNLVNFSGGIGVIARKLEDIFKAVSDFKGGQANENSNSVAQ